MDSSIRALVFADNRGLRRLLSEILRLRGYEVIAFPHPGMCPLFAMESCICQPPNACTDIIISDVDMPYPDGLPFMNHFHDRGCRCRHIALMSGDWDGWDMARARKLGHEVFHKPFEISELNDWLSKVEGNIDPARELVEWQTVGEICRKAGY